MLKNKIFKIKKDQKKYKIKLLENVLNDHKDIIKLILKPGTNDLILKLNKFWSHITKFITKTTGLLQNEYIKVVPYTVLNIAILLLLDKKKYN